MHSSGEWRWEPCQQASLYPYGPGRTQHSDEEQKAFVKRYHDAGIKRGWDLTGLDAALSRSLSQFLPILQSL